MANQVFNVALGRVAELYNRVDTNDPTNSVIVIVALDSSGIQSDAALKDMDTLSALLAGSTDEVTNSGYARKVLNNTDIVAFAPDDTNNRVDLDIPDQTWTSVGAGTNWSDVVICYDPDSTSGTDASIIPMTMHDFVTTPSGSDITLEVGSNGFYRAS